MVIEKSSGQMHGRIGLQNALIKLAESCKVVHYVAYKIEHIQAKSIFNEHVTCYSLFEKWSLQFFVK